MAQDLSVWLKLKTNFQSAVGWIAKSVSISNIVGLIWIAISVVICVLVAQDLARDVVTIEPISVPKTLSDGGYTSEVASHRMLDAVSNFVSRIRTNSSRQIDDTSVQLAITPRDELRDFLVPTIGLSLNTVISSIRSVLHYGSGQSISGEIVIHDNLAWLRVRVDGQQVFTSPAGVPPDNLDEQLAAAAPAVIEKIKPYLAAAAMYHDHPDQAIEKADDIIARLKESDANVQGAFVLKGNYFFDRGNYADAEKMLRKAVSLHWSNPTPHISLGRTLQRQGRLDEAITQYQRAISINPRAAMAHNNLGNALAAKAKPDGKLDDAMAEYRHAILIDRTLALPHYNLGVAFSQQGKRDEAMVEYRRAIELDPKYSNAHNNLGLALYNQGNVDGAMAEYRLAAEIDPKNPLPHNNLGLALNSQGNHDGAMAEYRLAIEIDPKYANAHANLGRVLYNQGNHDDAIAEYRRVIEIDPKSAVAHNNLGLVLYSQGRTGDAIGEYRRAIEIAPKYKDALDNLEKALQAQSAAAK